MEEEGGVGHVPAGAHLAAQRYLVIALGDQLVAVSAVGHSILDRHGRVHEAGQDDVGTDPVARVGRREILGKPDDSDLGGFVGNAGIGSRAAIEEILTMEPLPCPCIWGRAYLQVSHMPRRLMATIESKDSAGRSVAGASPSSTLTPTLL